MRAGTASETRTVSSSFCRAGEFDESLKRQQRRNGPLQAREGATRPDRRTGSSCILEERRGTAEWSAAHGENFPAACPLQAAPRKPPAVTFWRPWDSPLRPPGFPGAALRYKTPFLSWWDRMTLFPAWPTGMPQHAAAARRLAVLLVKQRDGRPIKIEGNAESTLFGGGTCATGQATVLSLYDDERLRGPLWHGQPASWQEIDQHVMDALREAAGSKREIVLLSGTIASPSTRSIIAIWRTRYPNFRHIEYDPVSSERDARGQCPIVRTGRCSALRFRQVSRHRWSGSRFPGNMALSGGICAPIRSEPQTGRRPGSSRSV